jgi:hypothetical protein
MTLRSVRLTVGTGVPPVARLSTRLSREDRREDW